MNESSPSRPIAGILVAVGENCLSRETVKSIAKGRCPRKELTAARRHLADCPRCRAAVVAAAHGVEGPGDTVLLKRSGGAVSKGLKVAAVSASILATGAAWRYGTAPKAEPPRDVRAQALEPAAASAAEPTAHGRDVSPSATWQRSVSVQRLGAPAPESAAAAASDDAFNAQPTVRVVNAAASEPPSVSAADESWRVPSDAIAAPTKRQSSRPAPSAARPSPRPASPPPAAARRETSDEYDFGIDELPPSKTKIRSTLD